VTNEFGRTNCTMELQGMASAAFFALGSIWLGGVMEILLFGFPSMGPEVASTQSL
jgi:hypothetical protein